MEVCNACRYCEGYCAVFPAMELRRGFTAGDLAYLANLCHDCRSCFHACQYAPPHQFAINVPKAFSEVRLETYAALAWPRSTPALFERNGLVVSCATAIGIAVVLGLTAGLHAPGVLLGRHSGPGAFYEVFPEGAMTAMASAACLYALIAFGVGAVRFWRGTGAGPAAGPVAVVSAAGDVLTLRNLGGGGHGCNDRDEAFSRMRRYSHHAVFYGFLLCLASTSAAAAYDHLFHWPAPYPFFSLPVLLGTAGGTGMLVGVVGLFWIRAVGNPLPASRKTLGADRALLAQLSLATLTGLLLLALRGTPAMGILLSVHLGTIFSWFILLPYSKFVHGLYHSLALLRHARERRAMSAAWSEGA
jgi:citrate/tricarballylate utilization protein